MVFAHLSRAENVDVGINPVSAAFDLDDLEHCTRVRIARLVQESRVRVPNLARVSGGGISSRLQLRSSPPVVVERVSAAECKYAAELENKAAIHGALPRPTHSSSPTPPQSPAARFPSLYAEKPAPAPLASTPSSKDLLSKRAVSAWNGGRRRQSEWSPVHTSRDSRRSLFET